MGKIKLLHVAPSLNKGGQEKQLFELVRRLDSQSYDIMVVSLSEGCFWTKEISRYARCVEIERKGRIELRRLSRLVSLIRDFRPDIIQCWSYSAIAYGISGALLASVPIKIITIRGKERCKSAVYLANNALYRLSDLVIYNSAEALMYEKRLYRLPERRAKVIYNGIDWTEFDPVIEDRSSVLGFPVPEGQSVIGTVASLTGRKNLKMFLEAAKEVLLKAAITDNVWQAMEDILRLSPIIREKVRDSQVQVVGALYDLDSGQVQWLGPHPDQTKQVGAKKGPAGKSGQKGKKPKKSED